MWIVCDKTNNLYGEIDTGSIGPCNSGPSSISIPGTQKLQEISKFSTHLLWGGSWAQEICQRRHSQVGNLPFSEFILKIPPNLVFRSLT